MLLLKVLKYAKNVFFNIISWPLINRLSESAYLLLSQRCENRQMLDAKIEQSIDNRELCTLIFTGKVIPSFVVSNEIGLNDALEVFRYFDARDMGYTEVILKP